MSYTSQFPDGFHDEDFQYAARHASDNRECVRLLGLSFLQKGLSEIEVAKLLEVHTQTVFGWLQRYKSGGTEAIYKAIIETESSGFDENSQLIPGMTVELNILAGKRTLLGYLMGPLSESI